MEMAENGLLFKIFSGAIVARSFHLVGQSVPLVELRGAWEGCRCAISELKASRVWLEGDAIGVIYWLSSKCKVGGYAEGLVRDTTSWLNRVEALKVSYILREGNSHADYMAKGGLMGQSMQFTMSKLPTELLKIVSEDAQGCCNQRSKTRFHYAWSPGAHNS